MNKAFRFIQPSGLGLRLVVMARTLKRARQYVKDQSISLVSYRSLRYVGEGHPSNPENWTGAIADKPESPSWIREPVAFPESDQ